MSQPNRTDEFVALFAANDRGIYKYILTLAANAADTQEIFQETSLALWRKFDEYQPGGNFFAWACRVAWFEVLKYRQSTRRRRLSFNDELLGTLAEERSAGEQLLQARRQALPDCMDKLPAADRELIAERYAGDETIRDLAERTGRSVHTLYKTLERIRRALMECIEEATGGNQQNGT
jgi:RNA polymerase sigma-70 factor (ECF subfamily)